MADQTQNDALYMGFDLSTQQLKALVVDSSLKLVHEAHVSFDEDLSKYGITKGVLTNEAEGEIFSPVAMLIEAVDLVLSRLKEQELQFGKVKGISGAGMQHGTVFWGRDAESILEGLDGGKSLLEQLSPGSKGERQGAFSHPFSPNWQDHSTQAQCDEFDKRLGGPEKLADATGSCAHHRFSGPQILRFHQKYPDAYRATSRISLVSSFLASIFLGRVAPIDIGDVGGMNLWDIQGKRWHPDLIALAAGKEGSQDLLSKLGDVPLDGGKPFGPISKYFVSRYGFPADCQIVPFTGDNPATILALPLRASDAIVSLGTSTTFLMATDQYKPDPAYHFLPHPTEPGLYMFMLCYKNGGLAREHIRDAVNASTSTTDKSWEHFNETATHSFPLNKNPSDDSEPAKLGLFFPRAEIVPNVRAGTWRYLLDKKTGKLTEATNGNDEKWGGASTDVRAILESQFLSCRLRSQKLVQKPAGGDKPAQPRRVYVVGGSSRNAAIARVCGDVLGGAEGVFRLDIGANACGLGAAYKAAWGVSRSQGEGYEDYLSKRWKEEGFVNKIDDGYRKGTFELYGEVLPAFEEMEKRVLESVAEGEKEKLEKRDQVGEEVR